MPLLTPLDPRPVERSEPLEVLVLWPQPLADEAVQRVAVREGLQPAEQVPLPALGQTMLVYRLSVPGAAAALRDRLLRDEPGAVADVNGAFVGLQGARHYARAQIGLPAQAPADLSARAASVGLLDGPVTRIPALDAVETTERNLLQPDDSPSRSGHGTEVATLIAGRDDAQGFAGAAPGARLLAGTVLRERAGRDEATARAVVTGLDWLAGAGAEVVNLSIGGDANRVVEHAVIALLARGIVVVAAAGNGGPGASPSYPAAYAGVVAVTAVDAAGAIYTRATRGDYVTLSAPGVDVWVPGREGGRYVSGTSYAAAWVSGVLARQLATAPARPAAEAQAALCADARDLGAPGRDPLFGCGLLQARDRALLAK